MARPTKEGLDYFPLNVDIEQDEKVALVEAEHGSLGFTVIIKLLMRIYKNSYFFEWGEKEQLLFTKVVNVDINSVNAIINDCIKWGFFNKELYAEYKILTSHGIQIRYLEATRRRSQVKVFKEYNLLSEKEVNDYNNIVFVDINSDNANNNPQSKGKESKGNKSKENDSKEAKTSELITEIFNYYFSKNIIKHSKLTNQMKSAITARLKDYSFEELTKAIDNYAFVLSSANHYFTHRYPLADFMRDKDIRKFVDEADPLNNFLDKKSIPKGGITNAEGQSSYEGYDFENREPDF
ncbi:DUF4373 domain-containing protein [Evansella cellulosilytica]|uniref:Lin1244/Lin1753-like N-terminal domain-containing protein n=1 Tax=Evansella cellulosilytica (strain ATCC 21833 / DSM 2522 / FERM P-1141 / JCM 9156 / N-4) TaxID=649639 RepID=E6TVI3_EVAC2|nr:DUF4373 domain-containing protein [Evansella cellulosilytica]ADU31000.1 hypothetical protein Bcell_2745 [Evansella cellulosilytica DSM 2522]